MRKKTKIHQIMSTAERLFKKHGIRRITVEEICREAGVSKVTFYKYFRNKHDLALRVIEEMITLVEKQYEDIRRTNVSFSGKIERMINMKLKYAEEMGSEWIADLMNSANTGIAALIESKRKENLQRFVDDFTEAQQRGEVRAKLRPEFILTMMDKIIEVFNDPAISSQYPSPKDFTEEILNFFFFGIFPKPEEKGVRDEADR